MILFRHNDRQKKKKTKKGRLPVMCVFSFHLTNDKMKYRLCWKNLPSFVIIQLVLKIITLNDLNAKFHIEITYHTQLQSSHCHCVNTLRIEGWQHKHFILNCLMSKVQWYWQFKFWKPLNTVRSFIQKIKRWLLLFKTY